jgi:hypothetical protein
VFVEKFDLVILGSGSTAFAAALRAQEMGKTAVMTEERAIGGTCVNRGCLPSKNLIEAAKLVYDARHPRYPGLEPTVLPINFRTLVGQKDEVRLGRSAVLDQRSAHERRSGRNDRAATLARCDQRRLRRARAWANVSSIRREGDGGRNGFAAGGQAARLHRASPRVPNDGRGAKNCRHLPLQGPGEVVLLCRVELIPSRQHIGNHETPSNVAMQHRTVTLHRPAPSGSGPIT